jgi:hypothetical protein
MEMPAPPTLLVQLGISDSLSKFEVATQVAF